MKLLTPGSAADCLTCGYDTSYRHLQRCKKCDAAICDRCGNWHDSTERDAEEYYLCDDCERRRFEDEIGEQNEYRCCVSTEGNYVS